MSSARIIACLLAATVCLHSASAATLLPETINISGSEGSYSEETTLPEVTLQTYRIIPPVPSRANYNVRIQLESSEGHAGFYCNPSWGGQPSSSSTIAQPKNAVWSTDNSQSDNLTISATDPKYLEPNNTRAAILSGLPSSSSGIYQPAFNCSAVNPSTAYPAVFTLTVTFDENNQTTGSTEAEGLISIFQSCCMNSSSCATWKNRTTGVIPYSNFCQFPGQLCSPSGYLQKLDLSSMGLSCAFPTGRLLLFSSLQTLILSGNPELRSSLATVMSQLANLRNLRHLELEQNTGITGPLADANPATSLGLCSVVQNGLRYLDFSNMQLSGSIPGCLFAAPGTLSQVGFAHNNLTGTIPDVIPANSSLFGMVLASNNLTGTIPGTLRNAGMLSNLELSDNQLQGSMPKDFAAGMSMLDTVQLSSNTLTGALPSSLATSASATTLDVSSNQLTALPLEWSNGFPDATQSLFNSIFLQQNRIQSPFPAALASMPRLLMFEASNNNLSGALPDVSGMFSQTRDFNVSNNMLTGTIPAAFSSVGAVNKSLGNLMISPTFALQRELDLSYNNFTGPVPAFLAKSSIPSATLLKMSLLGNMLTADCGNSSYGNLDICDRLLNGSASPAASAPTAAEPTVTIPPAAVLPAATTSPAAATSPAATTSPADTGEVTTQSGGGATASSSGIGSGAIAGIVIGIVVAVAVGATAVVVYVKRRRSNNRILLRMQSSGGFSRFEDF